MARTATKRKVVPFPGTGTHFETRLKKASRRGKTGMLMKHDEDPVDVILKNVGDISGAQVLNNFVLYAIYERPKVTAAGIHIPDQIRNEDQYQGKAGLILKVGPMANEDADLRGFKLEPGMWIAVRPSDGWALKLNGHTCRLINEQLIQLVIPAPDMVW